MISTYQSLEGLSAPCCVGSFVRKGCAELWVRPWKSPSVMSHVKMKTGLRKFKRTGQMEVTLDVHAEKLAMLVKATFLDRRVLFFALCFSPPAQFVLCERCAR